VRQGSCIPLQGSSKMDKTAHIEGLAPVRTAEGKQTWPTPQ
jgi:hypothetical protein